MVVAMIAQIQSQNSPNLYLDQRRRFPFSSVLQLNKIFPERREEEEAAVAEEVEAYLQ